MNRLQELRLRENCPMRHGNGNCRVMGGFCTAVNDEICDALHCAYDKGKYHALREQEERRKGCDWCANTEPGAIHTTVKRGNITFHDRAKLCPMCGRRLKEV